MTRTFEQMAAERDPLYAAMQPKEEFELAVMADERYHLSAQEGHLFQAESYRAVRAAALLILAVRALRNQGQPYYRV